MPLASVCGAVEVGSATRMLVPNGSATSGKLVYLASSSDKVPPTVRSRLWRHSISASRPFDRALAALKMTETVVAPTATWRCSCRFL